MRVDVVKSGPKFYMFMAEAALKDVCDSVSLTIFQT